MGKQAIRAMGGLIRDQALTMSPQIIVNDSILAGQDLDVLNPGSRQALDAWRADSALLAAVISVRFCLNLLEQVILNQALVRDITLVYSCRRRPADMHCQATFWPVFRLTAPYGFIRRKA